METFFILMVVVCLPVGWFIVRMLRYTEETVGTESPLYKEREYQFSAYQYFGQFTKVVWGFTLIEMIVISYVMAKAAIHQHEPLIFIFVFFFAGFAGFLGFIFYFDWQYWTITRHVLVTLNPFDSSIIVNGPTQYAQFTPADVIRFEHHLKKSSNSKDPLGGYGYLLFYGIDGRITRVNNIFFGHIEFLGRFFSSVPHAIVWHRLPWIEDLEPTGSPDSSNFATYNQR